VKKIAWHEEDHLHRVAPARGNIPDQPKEETDDERADDDEGLAAAEARMAVIRHPADDRIDQAIPDARDHQRDADPSGADTEDHVINRLSEDADSGITVKRRECADAERKLLLKRHPVVGWSHVSHASSRKADSESVERVRLDETFHLAASNS
jgi:hypothetical protein